MIRRRNEGMKWIMMEREKENINTIKNIEKSGQMENIRKRNGRRYVSFFLCSNHILKDEIEKFCHGI